MRKEVVTVKDNFFLVLERESKAGQKGRLVIRTSGYTSTVSAIHEPWILTQCKTIPHNNRDHLPDPVIMPQKMLDVYEDLDCNVLNLYFRPECKGLKYATREFGEYLEKYIFSSYDRHALVGHSKGGLFVGGVTEYLDKSTNIAMIAPTFGTMMGNEKEAFKVLDEWQEVGSKRMLTSLDIAIYKRVMHLIGSRRPIDYDMSIGSEFMTKELNLSNLQKHRLLLIMANCPRKKCGLDDAIFRHYGKYFGLDKHGDGMVSNDNQKYPCAFTEDITVKQVMATHPTVLSKRKTNQHLYNFLSEI